jgi:hypothetical protein
VPLQKGQNWWDPEGVLNTLSNPQFAKQAGSLTMPGQILDAGNMLGNILKPITRPIRAAVDPDYRDRIAADEFFKTPRTSQVRTMASNRPPITGSFQNMSRPVIPGSLPTGTKQEQTTLGVTVGRPAGDVNAYDYPVGVPFSWQGGTAKWNADRSRAVWVNQPSMPNTGTTVNTNANTRITSPNTIVQRGSASDGISDEYRTQLANWQALQKTAAGALKGFQPGSGPMPAAATEADQAGRDLWAKLHPDLAKPGGVVGTYNPLMQARGGVPSIEELWKGMPTSGPGRTSEDVTDEAMAKARAEGRYFEPSGTMGGFAPAADPATQQRMQQFGTAMQAQKGTEETSAAQRSQDFINRFKLGSLNPGSYNFPGYDANAMMNAPSALFK